MKNFGFGCMRLPMKDNEVDTAEFSRMIDAFLKAGFTYFDTAHGYLNGKSETALRECLTKRYPRDAYTITDKLTENYFSSEADIRPFFESQLAACGVTYFDWYLMHSQNAGNYQKFQKCNAYQVANALKDEGKIKHFGISFHDKADVLDRILHEHPEIEFVQIQFNYIDYENPGVESRKCYEVCRKHGKDIIIMEPVKGGSLVNLPDSADRILRELNGGSNASYALRFAAGFEGVVMVLSGMSNMEQMQENIGFMEHFKPLNAAERDAIDRVVEIFATQDIIPCTACRYCTDGCPQKISIPELFSCMNAKKQYRDWNSNFYYQIHTKDGGKASACIKCGKCEHACPQHLPIRELLVRVAEEFEKQE